VPALFGPGTGRHPIGTMHLFRGEAPLRLAC
jgi:hypothetical protein